MKVVLCSAPKLLSRLWMVLAQRRKRGREEAAGRVREGASKEWGTRGGKKRWEVIGRVLREEEKGSSGEWIACAQREEEKGRERVGDE